MTIDFLAKTNSYLSLGRIFLVDSSLGEHLQMRVLHSHFTIKSTGSNGNSIRLLKNSATCLATSPPPFIPFILPHAYIQADEINQFSVRPLSKKRSRKLSVNCHALLTKVKSTVYLVALYNTV